MPILTSKGRSRERVCVSPVNPVTLFFDPVSGRRPLTIRWLDMYRVKIVLKTHTKVHTKEHTKQRSITPF